MLSLNNIISYIRTGYEDLRYEEGIGMERDAPWRRNGGVSRVEGLGLLQLEASRVPRGLRSRMAEAEA